MTDVADLWNRIEEAKKRLGAADEAQTKQIQDINEQVKEVRAGLSQRYRELERHREEVSKLRRENEQLRRMLHRLLLAIEQRYSGRLMDLVKDLEGEVSALFPLATAPKQGRAQSQETRVIAKTPMPRTKPLKDTAAVSAAPDNAGTQKYAAAAPSESDSRWLQEIMERARELTGEDGASPPEDSSAGRPQGAAT